MDQQNQDSNKNKLNSTKILKIIILQSIYFLEIKSKMISGFHNQTKYKKILLRTYQKRINRKDFSCLTNQLRFNKIWSIGQVSDLFVMILKPTRCKQNTTKKFKNKHPSCHALSDLKIITPKDILT